MIKVQQLKFVDYHDTVKEVEKLTNGREVRDWKCKFRGTPHEEYCDFWHVLLEYLDGFSFSNGCYLPVNFRDMATWERETENRDWVIEIADLFHRTIPDEIKQEFVSEFDEEPGEGETELDKAQICFRFEW